MRIDVDIALLQEYADRHNDFMREYRLTGDVKYLKSFVQDIIDKATEGQTEEEKIAEFKKTMTDKEHHVLYTIFNEINQSGNVSVVKLVQKTGISRPVIDNLLSKLKTYGIAEVVNQGVKGTKITFLVYMGGLVHRV